MCQGQRLRSNAIQPRLLTASGASDVRDTYCMLAARSKDAMPVAPALGTDAVAAAAMALATEVINACGGGAGTVSKQHAWATPPERRLLLQWRTQASPLARAP